MKSAVQSNDNHDERGRFDFSAAVGGQRDLPGKRVLTSDERSALELYAIGGVKGYGHDVSHVSINRALRAGADGFPSGAEPHVIEIVGQMDSAFAKIEPLTEEKTVFRGMPARGLSVGDEVHDLGYASTTTQEWTAKSFAAGRSYKGIATIRLPVGTRALDMITRTGARIRTSGLGGTAIASEHEWLLPRGSRFRVTSVTPGAMPAGMARIGLELLPRAANYDPDQARDENGRWASGGGTAIGPIEAKVNSDLARSREVGDYVGAKNKECYKNSCMAVASESVPKGSVYVEGYATDPEGLPFPIAHGWIETPDGSIIDPTPVWNEKLGARYFGARSYTREQIWAKIGGPRTSYLPFDTSLGMGHAVGSKAGAAYKSAWTSIVGAQGMEHLFGGLPTQQDIMGRMGRAIDGRRLRTSSKGDGSASFEELRGRDTFGHRAASFDTSILGRATRAVQKAMAALAGGPVADMQRWLTQLFGQDVADALMDGIRAADLAPYVSYPAPISTDDLVRAGNANPNHDEAGRFAEAGGSGGLSLKKGSRKKGADDQWADGQYAGTVPPGGFKKSPEIAKDFEEQSGTFAFAQQAGQYPTKGKEGIGYFKGELTEDEYVDCLLYRDKSGKVIGVLNHFPQDVMPPWETVPWERKGNVTVMVHPDSQRQGIGTALVREAGARWGINLAQQKFSSAGAALANSVSGRARVPDLPTTREAARRK